MRKRNKTCVKVVYNVMQETRNPSEIKGSERTYAKILDFTGFLYQAFSLSGNDNTAFCLCLSLFMII